ncbi:MAG: hypothetical protein NC318_08135 [Blautia sp.]|nr:hypothetical protein [Lachnoclostridium sp.]MCM1211558.1 hypothetical protein [Blautia sp.]
MIKTQQEQWAKKVNEIIASKQYTKSKFAELCGVSRVSVDKWCKGSIPKNRETFLKIGMAAGYDIEHMNQLLQRYGRYPGLYSKSLEDCVCIFVLTHDYGAETISEYQYILNRIKGNIIRDDSVETENISTVKFDAKLSEVQDEDELEKFVTENIAMFSFSYHKFYAYVKMCINANYQEFSSSVFDMAQGQGWSSSLRQCVSAIRQNKWYPTRNKIISLGLHLSMDHDQIDEMLLLAHMEPLCAKNIFESVIMFILDDASLNNMLDASSDKYDPDELCRYAREVLEKLNLPGVEAFISELPEVDDAW